MLALRLADHRPLPPRPVPGPAPVALRAAGEGQETERFVLDIFSLVVSQISVQRTRAAGEISVKRSGTAGDLRYNSSVPVLNNGLLHANKRLISISLLIFSAALSLRIALLAWSDLKNTIYRVETDRIALSIAEGRGYANPFNCATGPTAHCPPLYPALMGLFYSVFGAGLAGELAKGVFHLLLISCCLGLLPLSSKLLTGRLEPGVFAGYLGVLTGCEIVIELHGREMGLMAIFVLISGLLYNRRLQENQIGCRQGVRDGVFYGAGLLTGAHLLPVLAASTGLIAWQRRGKAREYIVTLIAAASVFLLPWAVRNRLMLGQWVVFRSNFWLEMQVSNNDQSKTDVLTNLVKSEGRRHHPFTNKEECELYANLGEVAYMERKRKMFLEWLGQNPVKFARFSLDRARMFWFPPRGSQLVLPHLQWAITVLGWLGLWLMRRQGVAIWRWIALLWLVYPPVYYLVQFDYRYRYPIQWTLLLCTGWVCRNRFPGQFFDYRHTAGSRASSL